MTDAVAAELRVDFGRGTIIPFAGVTNLSGVSGNFSLEQAVEQLGTSIRLAEALEELEQFQTQLRLETLPEALTRSAAEEVTKALETVRIGVSGQLTTTLTPTFEQAVSQAFDQLEQFQGQLPEELKAAIDGAEWGDHAAHTCWDRRAPAAASPNATTCSKMRMRRPSMAARRRLVACREWPGRWPGRPLEMQCINHGQASGAEHATASKDRVREEASRPNA